MESLEILQGWGVGQTRQRWISIAEAAGGCKTHPMILRTAAPACAAVCIGLVRQ